MKQVPNDGLMCIRGLVRFYCVHYPPKGILKSLVMGIPCGPATMEYIYICFFLTTSCVYSGVK